MQGHIEVTYIIRIRKGKEKRRKINMKTNIKVRKRGNVKRETCKHKNKSMQVYEQMH